MCNQCIIDKSHSCLELLSCLYKLYCHVLLINWGVTVVYIESFRFELEAELLLTKQHTFNV